MDLEKAALKLIKTTKTFDDKSATDTQRNENKTDRKESTTKQLAEERFDFEEYYKNFKFDPKVEINKERQIMDFFKVRARFLLFSLGQVSN